MGVFIVTGATGGIGRATALLLLGKNYEVVVTGRNKNTLLAQYGSFPNAKILDWDISQTNTLDAYINEIRNKYGLIQGLVHCAGFDKMTSLQMNKADMMNDLMNIHAIVPIKLCGLLSKKGFYDERASIVLISSLAAHQGAVGHTAYAAAKGALEGFLPSAAKELANRKIRINIVVPGIVETPMSDGNFSFMTAEQKQKLATEYPFGLGRPADVASAIYFFISENSRWITGSKLILNGGNI